MDIFELRVLQSFPNLNSKGYKITSPRTTSYNCFAWATGDDKRRWEPDLQFQYYWPSDIPREFTIEAFIALFKKFGYAECKDDSLEKNYEKIAIYTNTQNIPQHAARQLYSGKWTSKLGDFHDIEHTLDGLEGNLYGKVKVIMKKEIKKYASA